MKKIIYSLSCLSGILAMHRVTAQAPGIEWAYVYPAYIGSGTCVEPTSDSGYIVGGVFASHFLAIKLDDAGTEQWHRWISSEQE